MQELLILLSLGAMCFSFFVIAENDSSSVEICSSFSTLLDADARHSVCRPRSHTNSQDLQ